MPEGFLLSQNFPNPFNAVTSISFTLPEELFVTIKIYRITGKKVATLTSDIFLAGTHSVEWDASDYASSIYLYR